MWLCVKLGGGVAWGGGCQHTQVGGGCFYSRAGLVSVTWSPSITESQQSRSRGLSYS